MAAGGILGFRGILYKVAVEGRQRSTAATVEGILGGYVRGRFRLYWRGA